MQLRPHQISAGKKILKSLLTHGVSADESDLGTGKTAVALSVAKALTNLGELTERPVVITLASVVASWEEWAKIIGIEIEVRSYDWARRHLGTTIVWGKGRRWLWTKVPQMVIFDEAHKTAGLTSTNSKMLLSAVNQKAKFIHLMSATLFLSVLDLKAIGATLGLHKGKDFYHFLLKHGAKPGVFGGWDVKVRTPREKTLAKKHMDSIRLRIAEKTVRVRREEIPGFPTVENEVMLLDDPHTEAEKLAEELYDLYVARRAEGENEDVRAATRIIRLRQALELAKIPQLVEAAEKYARVGRVAFFVNFDESADALIAKLTKLFGNCEMVRGGQPKLERQRSIEAFQNGLSRAIVVNMQAGGAGMSLHDPTGQSETTSFFLPSFSAIDLIQATGRDHRLGGAHSRHFFVYFNSPTEKRVATVLRNKLSNLESITNDDLLGITI